MKDDGTSKAVFLGGTCNGSGWRPALIVQFNENVSYFNPVVEDWTPECVEEELRQRERCEICLYVITPAMEGAYSIAEVIDDSNKRPDKTVFCFLEAYDGKRFSDTQVESLNQVARMVEDNGGKHLHWEELASYINDKVVL